MSKLLAPNKKPSNLSAEQYHLVRTPAFIKWFGNWIKAYETKDYTDVSKVIDENGEPLVVYHGTHSNFNIFKYGQLGYHFGTKKQAELIVRDAKILKWENYIKECFLNLKNPLYTIDFPRWEWYIVSKILYKYEILNKKEFDTITKNKKGQQENILKDILFQKGYDGFKYDNEFEGTGISYIAFNPNQIKLADGSNTTFESNNPDIRFYGGGSVNKKEIYEGKREWAARRMEKNKMVDTLTEEQHEALAWLAEVRHKIHTNQKSMFLSQSSDYNELWSHIDDIDEDKSIYWKLTNVGLKNDLSWDVSNIPNDYDYNLPQEEGGYGIESYDEAFEILIEFLEKVNSDIEVYLTKIDEEHGTNYAPSGYTRFEDGGSVHEDIDTFTEKVKKEIEKAGYYVYKGSQSKTDFGNSNYLYVAKSNNDEDYIKTIKVRISDHSVGNINRIFNEIHIGYPQKEINRYYGGIDYAIKQIDFALNRDKYFRSQDDYITESNKFEVGEKGLRPTDKIISERLSTARRGEGRKVYYIQREKKVPVIIWIDKRDDKVYKTFNKFDEGGSIDNLDEYDKMILSLRNNPEILSYPEGFPHPHKIKDRDDLFSIFMDWRGNENILATTYFEDNHWEFGYIDGTVISVTDIDGVDFMKIIKDSKPLRFDYINREDSELSVKNLKKIKKTNLAFIIWNNSEDTEYWYDKKYKHLISHWTGWFEEGALFKTGGNIQSNMDNATKITDDNGVVRVESGQAIINAHNAQAKDHKHEFDGKQLTHLEIISAINQQSGGNAMTGNKAEITNDARDGGVFSGQKHSECSDKGCGIKGVVVDTNTHIEVEDKEPILKKEAVQCNCTHTFDGKNMTNKEILTAINTEGGWGVPIYDKGGKLAEGGEIKSNSNKEKFIEYLNSNFSKQQIKNNCCYYIYAESKHSNTDLYVFCNKKNDDIYLRNYQILNLSLLKDSNLNKNAVNKILLDAGQSIRRFNDDDNYGLIGEFNNIYLIDHNFYDVKTFSNKNKMILYHVSQNDFDKFDYAKSGEVGIHFMDDKNFIIDYFKKGILYTVEVQFDKLIKLPIDMNRWKLYDVKALMKNQGEEFNPEIDYLFEYPNINEYIWAAANQRAIVAKSYFVLSDSNIKIIKKEYFGSFETGGWGVPIYDKGGNVMPEGGWADKSTNDIADYKYDFNYIDNKELRTLLESFWAEFTKSNIANYLNINENNYEISDKDGLFVIHRNKAFGDFTEVEKNEINNWINSYLDINKKPLFSKYFENYKIVDGIIIIKIKDLELYVNGGNLYDRGNRPSPKESATLYDDGYEMQGQDGNMYRIVVDSRGVHRWQKINLSNNAKSENAKPKIKETEKLETIKTKNMSTEIKEPEKKKISIVDQTNIEIRKMLHDKGLNRVLYSEEDLKKLILYTGHTKTEEEVSDGYLWDFFTPDEVVKIGWRLAYKYGFTAYQSTKILEPSCGIGRFLRYAPDICKVTGYDIDEISYKIAKLLFPRFTIINESFETAFYYKSGLSNYDYKASWETYDLAIGNPPYKYPYESNFSKKEKKMYPMINSMEEWFIMRGVDSLNKNGLLIYVVPSTIVDNDNTKIEFKEKLFEKCNMLDLYRLPSGTFKDTQITTDIIVLQKK